MTFPRTFLPGQVGVLGFALSFSVALQAAAIDGIPNSYKVNENVYRGGQPTVEGFRKLARLGVKTILDLREEDDDRKVEKKVVRQLGMKYVHIAMKGMTTPTERQ